MKRLIITASKQEEKNGRTEEVAEQATHGTDPEDAIYIIQTALESISSELVDAGKEVITSYYIRIKRDRDLHPDIMPGTVRLLVQLQQPAPTGESLNMAGRLPGTPQESFQHKVSVSGQRCKQRDGFLIDRLVMSINIRRISY